MGEPFDGRTLGGVLPCPLMGEPWEAFSHALSLDGRSAAHDELDVAGAADQLDRCAVPPARYGDVER